MSTTISFDIGIKNLAYCVFHIDPSFDSILIRDWGVINLSTSEQAPSTGPVCNCQKAKSGTCGKKASYYLGDNFLCNVHAKNSGKLFPSKETSMPSIRKLKVDELTQFARDTISQSSQKTNAQICFKRSRRILINALSN